ncbi:LysR family transcriptional regulator [Tyzzerella sp. OttesenSCG-928-J15]|nr:LysR family transcriptional regulator [Tyzzerella sp. OttesenSCG-928-J15]
MNIHQLKYIVEVANTKSITKASENLYINQPNISRSIAELENELGISLFSRTSKGMILTATGEEVYIKAKNILAEIKEIERMAAEGEDGSRLLKISVPRAGYFSAAISNMAGEMEATAPISIDFKESCINETIEDVASKECSIGIIRYPVNQEDIIINILREKKLQFDELTFFKQVLFVSSKSHLSDKAAVSCEDLKNMTEIAISENLQLYTGSKPQQCSESMVYLYDRESLLSVLSKNKMLYMWESPLPKEIMRRYSLTAKSCADKENWYKDMLIYREKYKLSSTDKRFIDHVCAVRREIF